MSRITLSPAELGFVRVAVITPELRVARCRI